jgi:uncharacterized SAM-binding protein YcdF (DUF218 family)
MSRLHRVMIGSAGAALWLLLFGFVMFAAAVMRDPASNVSRADGIVVLTGGETRIAEGARLLKAGRGERLLISGVNPVTRPNDVQRISGLPAPSFTCCVDLGYSALDTIGNADETKAWAETHNYDSLIIVTASYHMPRSLAELGRAMPSIRLIPHPVSPKGFRTEAWWLNYRTTRILVSEYLKFLPAAARFGVARLLWPAGGGSFATAGAAGPGS